MIYNFLLSIYYSIISIYYYFNNSFTNVETETSKFSISYESNSDNEYENQSRNESNNELDSLIKLAQDGILESQLEDSSINELMIHKSTEIEVDSVVGEADSVMGEADSVVGEADSVMGEADSVVGEADSEIDDENVVLESNGEILYNVNNMWYCDQCAYYNPPLCNTCISCNVIKKKINQDEDWYNDKDKDKEWEILNELL